MTARPRPWSLSARLGWRLAAVMLAAIVLAAAAVLWRTVAKVHELDDMALRNEAMVILDRLPAAPPKPGEEVALPADLVARYLATGGDNAFLVYADGRLVGASDPRVAATFSAVLPPAVTDGPFALPPLAHHHHPRDGFAVTSGPWQVMVLQEHERIGSALDAALGRVLTGLMWLLVPIGIATVAVGEFTLRRGLRPLRDVSAAAARIRPGQEGTRLPTAALPREIVPLVQTVNDALARLEQALTTQRRFMADAAHTLRTPLAVLTARLDSLPSGAEVEALRADADRMGRLVAQLLRIARLEGGPMVLEDSVDLHAVAVEAVSGLVPLAIRRDIALELAEGAAVAPVRGNKEALVLALVNLIENAMAHAPAGGAVEVEVAKPARLVVRDRGPGVPADQVAHIFGRFERGANAPPGGAGLGLAIVAGIAAAHGGKASAAAREGGGAEFTLSLWSEAGSVRP